MINREQFASALDTFWHAVTNTPVSFNEYGVAKSINSDDLIAGHSKLQVSISTNKGPIFIDQLVLVLDGAPNAEVILVGMRIDEVEPTMQEVRVISSPNNMGEVIVRFAPAPLKVIDPLHNWSVSADKNVIFTFKIRSGTFPNDSVMHVQTLITAPKDSKLTTGILASE